VVVHLLAAGANPDLQAEVSYRVIEFRMITPDIAMPGCISVSFSNSLICTQCTCAPHTVIIFCLVLENYSHCLTSLSQDGFAALHATCQEGHESVADMLLQAGANVEQETKVRWSC